VKQRFLKLSAAFFLIALFLLPVSLFAFDFGLITNHYMAYGNKGADKDTFTWQSDILPRFSFLIGDNADFFFSAGLTLGFEDDFYYVPELLRTEFSMRFSNSAIKAGRISYADPLSFLASGLFDGVQFSHNSAIGNFSVGALYTGLLYKKTANITMTAADQTRYDSVLDYNSFSETYFAPPRFLTALDWEHPSVAQLFALRAAFIGQVDFSDEDEKYDSQYFTIKAVIPVKNFLFELGGSLETSQLKTSPSNVNDVALAWSLGVFWTLPTSFNSRLSLAGNFAGGGTDDLGAFVPITTKSYGDILEAKLSGLSVIELKYTARFTETIGTDLKASFFVRNDLATYQGYPLDDEAKDEYFLGTEIFARFVWSPVSDLQLNLGGGAFFPALGNVSDKKPLWRVELSAILAIL